jgi:hypothetical protein
VEVRDGFDPERIVEVLERHAVACIVVGGYGAQLHGASRLTTDLDLVADFDRENLRRLAAAMRELNARARVEGYVDPATIEASKSLVHEDFLAGIEISTWDTDAGPLDVLRNIPDATGVGQRYEELVERAVAFRDHRGLVIQVAALDDIVVSKEWSKRPKDLEALDELHDLQRRDLRSG